MVFTRAQGLMKELKFVLYICLTKLVMLPPREDQAYKVRFSAKFLILNKHKQFNMQEQIFVSLKASYPCYVHGWRPKK